MPDLADDNVEEQPSEDNVEEQPSDNNINETLSGEYIEELSAEEKTQKEFCCEKHFKIFEQASKSIRSKSEQSYNKYWPPNVLI